MLIVVEKLMGEMFMLAFLRGGFQIRIMAGFPLGSGLWREGDSSTFYWHLQNQVPGLAS